MDYFCLRYLYVSCCAELVCHVGLRCVFCGYLCVCVFLCVCQSLSHALSLSLSMCFCGRRLCVVYVSCICLHSLRLVCEYKIVCVCVGVCVPLPMSACLSVQRCVCHLSVFQYMSISVCVCACVCVCWLQYVGNNQRVSLIRRIITRGLKVWLV